MPTPLQDALKLIYLSQDLGEYALVPDGAVVNIGGVLGPNFTVDGKPLLFADGTSTDGTTINFLAPDFQAVYQNSVGEAFIDFTSGKDFVLQAVNNNQFRFDADTGDVTISGNLIVEGETQTVINASVDTDRVEIHQTAGSYIPFVIEPRGGVTPFVNVVDIKVARSGASVFTIGPTGVTYIQSLNVGLVNGIDFTALNAAFLLHAETATDAIKHPAKQISVNTAGMGAVTGSNVQEAIASIASALSTVGTGNVQGLEYVQAAASKTWTIIHNRNTKKVQITIWDSVDEQVLADTIHVFDANTVVVRFNTAITGRAILMLF